MFNRIAETVAFAAALLAFAYGVALSNAPRIALAPAGAPVMMRSAR